MFLEAMIIAILITFSGSNMHQAMCKAVLHSKIIFFDSNPIGRILTRFSKDMVVFDLILPGLATFASNGAFRAIAVFTVVSIINPWLIIAAVIAMVLMALLTRIALRPMVETQRMDSMFRSPVHSTFSMLVDGVITLRAYEKNDFFAIDFLRNLEKGANVTFMNHAANRWLGIRIDFVIFMFASCTAALAVASKGILPTELLSFTL